LKPPRAPDGHPEVPPRRVGVLLINLGTPDAPDAAAVRRYLAEFLSDPRVIEIPAIAWKPILHGIILRTRPKKSAHAYKQVWTNDGSPLASITRKQTKALQERLGSDVLVEFAMRYGNPGRNGASAALPAILRCNDRHCARRIVRGAGTVAAATVAPDSSPIL
jgi:ferrochelatase